MQTFKPLPEIYTIESHEISDNYFQIKYDIKSLIKKEVVKIIEDAGKINSQQY
ncbi:MAG: hypothetical protein JWN76_1673 [Chitinophagaceae bacterium]|nr:hypothetical protein [Chitinophagaceae bacterium]